MDARAVRTRSALVDAMVLLVKEKGFDQLRLNEILAEADVGRSTFYGHFTDKDDLLISSFVGMIDMTDKAEVEHYRGAVPFVLPSASLLHHIQEFSDFAQKIAASELFDAQMEAGEHKLRAIAERRIGALYPQISGPERKRAAVFVAGAFIGMVKWWMRRGLREDWRGLDRTFRAMVETGLRSGAAGTG
jgi:AcrR family transcriptional regulator